MTDTIQRARDMLKKWRDIERAGEPWRVQMHGTFATVRDDQNGEVARSVLDDDAALIVGTAGNPDLLDAIDALLDIGGSHAWASTVAVAADRIAAAIIAADERMNQ